MTVYFLGSSGMPVAEIQNGPGSVHGIHYDLGAQVSLQLVRRDA
jgi:hypothetical protein